MERLPDIPDAVREQEYDRASRDKGSKREHKTDANKKELLKEKLSTYGLLVLLVVVIIILTQKTEVTLNDITVTDCSGHDSPTSFFVAGELLEGQKFANAQVEFDEDTGIAEITLYRYTTPTFFGTREFVALIDTSEKNVKEVWLKSGEDKLQIM